MVTPSESWSSDRYSVENRVCVRVGHPSRQGSGLPAGVSVPEPGSPTELSRADSGAQRDYTREHFDPMFCGNTRSGENANRFRSVACHGRRARPRWKCARALACARRLWHRPASAADATPSATCVRVTPDVPTSTAAPTTPPPTRPKPPSGCGRARTRAPRHRRRRPRSPERTRRRAPCSSPAADSGT